ncbi:DksA/TraR family C4-type zinc finger protein [Orbus sasakiae]|uniref:DksA/TraR family C4-type zinc finger protein n=1 Tax=Orbus sasakiae TaxID=1078475 RepID=A0ABP9N663_9GAMM
MASGWASDDAVNQQIESTITDAIQKVRRQLNTQTVSEDYCLECGNKIAEARKKAIAGVQYCITCQNDIDKQRKNVDLFNRRGSKDSQLR